MSSEAIADMRLSGRHGTPAAQQGAGVLVDVERVDLFLLALKNLALTLLTLGFYRFWARTAVRRMLWESVSIQGQRLSYTGKARELLIGFLLALVVLLPAFSLLGLAGTMVPPGSFVATLAFQGISFLVLGLLGVMALYFARRYLLTRTRWRDIHAGQAGSLGRFMAIHIGYYLLLALTLGASNPHVQARLHNYRFSITHYGTEPFAAGARAKGLWLRWLLTWAMALAGYLLVLYGNWPVSEWAMALPDWQAANLPPPPRPDIMGIPVAIGALLLVGAFTAYAFYRAAQLKAFAEATQLGAISFSFPVPALRLLVIPLVAMVLMILVVALAVGGVFLLFSTIGVPQIVALLAPLIIIILVFGAWSIIGLVWSTLAYMRLAEDFLRIHNIAAADDILNRGAPAPRRGEGLADALGDVGI